MDSRANRRHANTPREREKNQQTNSRRSFPPNYDLPWSEWCCASSVQSRRNMSFTINRRRTCDCLISVFVDGKLPISRAGLGHFVRDWVVKTLLTVEVRDGWLPGWLPGWLWLAGWLTIRWVPVSAGWRSSWRAATVFVTIMSIVYCLFV